MDDDHPMPSQASTLLLTLLAGDEERAKELLDEMEPEELERLMELAQTLTALVRGRLNTSQS